MLVCGPYEGLLLDGTKEHIEKWPNNDCSDPERYDIYNEELEGSFWGKNAFFLSFCHLFLSLWFNYSIGFMV